MGRIVVVALVLSLPAAATGQTATSSEACSAWRCGVLREAVLLNEASAARAEARLSGERKRHAATKRELALARQLVARTPVRVEERVPTYFWIGGAVALVAAAVGGTLLGAHIAGTQ